MGLIRFLLACAVIIEHTSPVFGMNLTGGTIAVQAFFMISGFYMALILNQKYVGAGSYSLFITNRFLKLFPIYWIVLAGVVLFGAYHWLRHGNLGVLSVWSTYALHWTSAAYLALTNLLIFGQDLSLFLKFTPDMGLGFTAHFADSTPRVVQFLLIPPAWSLGIELVFYVMAPFLVRRSAAFLGVLLTASLILRYVILVRMGLANDPWPTRFYPMELAFFVAGAICFKAYVAIPWPRIPKKALSVPLLLVLAMTVFAEGVNIWAFYACFALAMPFVFQFTKHNAFDRKIGDLSYPMYISHLLVLWTLSASGIFDRLGGDYRGLLTVVCTAVVSIGLLWVSRPIENWRSRRVAEGYSSPHTGQQYLPRGS